MIGNFYPALAPVRITVKSCPLSFEVSQGMSPMFSPEIDLKTGSGNHEKIGSLPPGLGTVTYNTIFYGRGRGIHSTSPFAGIMLKELLKDYFPQSRRNLMGGMLCIAGMDGYRSSVSYSELFNRNDQQEFLLVMTEPGEDGGLFRIFPAADFFSDRAIKSVSSISMFR